MQNCALYLLECRKLFNNLQKCGSKDDSKTSEKEEDKKMNSSNSRFSFRNRKLLTIAILILLSLIFCGIKLRTKKPNKKYIFRYVKSTIRTTINPIPYLRENGGCRINWDGSIYGCSFESTQKFVRINEKGLSFFRPGRLEHKFCFDYHTIGHRLGDLFTSIGCAHIAGLHLSITGNVMRLYSIAVLLCSFYYWTVLLAFLAGLHLTVTNR